MRFDGTNLVFFIIIYFYLIPFAAAAKDETALLPISGDRIILDLKYNSDDNFLHKNIYAEFGLTQCYVRPELKSRLQPLFSELKSRKLRLVLFDCYRPLPVQRRMWSLVPDTRYVANPKKGSNHNRGVAIDATLATEDGHYLPMPSAFDDFSPKAFRSYACPAGGEDKCNNRKLFEDLMSGVGLTGLPTEWWHYELPNAKTYPIVEDLGAGSRK